MVPPAGAEAALYIYPGQWLFQWVDSGRQFFKYVSPATVRQALSKEPIDSGWIPANVIRWGTSRAGVFMVGFYPPALYDVPVEMEGQPVALRIPLPALVFAGINSGYYMWAMKDAVLNPSGQLFQAPLPNINKFGLICFGSNDHPHVSRGGFQRAWEMIWRSAWNDHHMQDRSKAAPADVRTQLKSLHEAQAQEFPLDDLVPMHTTLDGAVKRLTRRGGEDF
jgi:PRTRC genetic system protein B